MKIILDFNEEQAAALKRCLQTAAYAIWEQENAIKEELEKTPGNNISEAVKLSRYLTEVIIPERAVIAEILLAYTEAEQEQEAKRIIV